VDYFALLNPREMLRESGDLNCSYCMLYDEIYPFGDSAVQCKRMISAKTFDKGTS
jgi:hypothetical protein